MPRVVGNHSLKTAAGDAPMDARVARSRQAIGAALMALLAEGRPCAEISISEVAARAGVMRKTFYAHFDSIEAVVRALALDLFLGTLSAIDDSQFRLPLSGSRLGIEVFRKLHERLDVLVPLTTLCPNELFLKPARESIERVVTPRIEAVNELMKISDFDRTYLSHLTSAAMLGAMTAWASRGFKDAPEEVGTFVMGVLAPASDRIFEAAARVDRKR